MAQSLHHLGQYVRRDRRNDADPQRGAVGVGEPTGRIVHRLGGRQRLAEMRHQRSPRGGELSGASVTLEHLGVQHLLELGHLGAQRGLRHATRVRGAPEGAEVRDRHHVLELPECEVPVAVVHSKHGRLSALEGGRLLLQEGRDAVLAVFGAHHGRNTARFEVEFGSRWCPRRRWSTVASRRRRPGWGQPQTGTPARWLRSSGRRGAPCGSPGPNPQLLRPTDAGWSA